MVSFICNHFIQNLVNIKGRSIINGLGYLGQVRHTAGHIFEPVLIGFIIRDMLNRYLRSGFIFDLLSQGLNSNFFIVTDIKYLAD